MTTISKRLRFDIFKRDSFTCQYCGRTPPEVRLEVDHIDPRAAGGTNDQINLITACFECNSGKSAVPLESKTLHPDAVETYRRMQQELLEAQAFLDMQIHLDDIRAQVVSQLHFRWRQKIKRAAPSEQVIEDWFHNYRPADISDAIDILATQFAARPERFPTALDCWKYVSSILRNRRQQDARTA